jgi:uncharacterized protein YecT (DUF1311 family)
MFYLNLSKWTYLLLVLFSCTTSSQNTIDIKQFEASHQKQIDEYRKSLEQEEYGSIYQKALLVEYEIDLYKVELYEAEVAGSGGTTQSIVEGRNAAYNYYDVMLNKYYNLLLSKLNEPDKEILRQSQRNWVKYRDSELQLNVVIAGDEYSGGGSIQRIYHAERKVGIVKSRLEEIVGYLERGE